jgi:hypothetical protein
MMVGETRIQAVLASREQKRLAREEHRNEKARKQATAWQARCSSVDRKSTQREKKSGAVIVSMMA